MSTNIHIPPMAAMNGDATKHIPWIKSGRGSKADSSPQAHISKLVGSKAAAMANCFQDQRRFGLGSVMVSSPGGQRLCDRWERVAVQAVGSVIGAYPCPSLHTFTTLQPRCWC